MLEFSHTVLKLEENTKDILLSQVPLNSMYYRKSKHEIYDSLFQVTIGNNASIYAIEDGSAHEIAQIESIE